MPILAIAARFCLSRTLLLPLLLTGCVGAVATQAGAREGRPARVRPGVEVLLSDSLACVTGKALGLVTNQTGIDSRGRSTASLLQADKSLRLLRLFSPEHGLDGSRPAGERVQDEVDPASGLPVTSLYQGSRAVDPALLLGLDQVLFDIQDIGIRPYTFTSTLAEVMKAARLAGVEVVVLDRPNPLGGELVSGLTLEPEWASFIGLYPVPYLHGMTVGELARLYNGVFGIGCRLRVIPMSGWTRDMTFDRTGLPWVPTSPNVPTWDTPLAMSITGPLGELGCVSIGIGTASPFWEAGAPGVDTEALVERLDAAQLPGLAFMPWRWTPTLGSWSGKPCQGARMLVLDPRTLDPGLCQLAFLEALQEQLDSLTTGASAQQQTMFKRAMGTGDLLAALQAGGGLDVLRMRMKDDQRAFRERRRPFLLYPEP